MATALAAKTSLEGTNKPFGETENGLVLVSKIELIVSIDFRYYIDFTYNYVCQYYIQPNNPN